MTHFTESQRIKLEQYLNIGYSIRKISKLLNFAPSSISREINRNCKVIHARNNYLSINCSHRSNCPLREGRSIALACSTSCKSFEQEKCNKLSSKGIPSICNSCKKYSSCRLEKHVYRADNADNIYKSRICISRPSTRITDEDFNDINELFTSKMKKGQSISVIYNNHANEMPVCENTIRTYLRKGLLDSDLLDSIRPRFNALKSIKKPRVIKDIELLSGRTFADYTSFVESNDSIVVQVDTVVGKLVDKKKILTLHWPSFHFQIGLLLNSLSPQEVVSKFKELQEKLGIDVYSKLFSVVLTDNGIEFSSLDEIEVYEKTAEVITNVFFCDPYCSSQKGACERNHELIRYILPKGTSFEGLTQEKLNLIFSHINSLPRKSIGSLSPYDLMEHAFGERVLNSLSIIRIDKDDIHLKPNLIDR